MTSHNPPTTQQLDAIETRVSAATPGPWQREAELASHIVHTAPKDGTASVLWAAELATEADGEFTAHARTDVPLLLAEVRRLNALNAELDRALGETIDDRDQAQEIADKLAYAVAPIEVIGEHSSMNCPWTNALELVTPAADVDKLRDQVAAVLAVHEKGVHNGLDICLHCASQMFPPPESGIWSESAYPCATLRALGVAESAAAGSV